MCRSVFSLAQLLFLLGTLNAFKETLFKTMETGGTDVTDICPNHTTDEILMITCKRSGKTECLVSLKFDPPVISSTCDSRVKLQIERDGVFLNITNIQPSDEGIYYCECAYNGGTDNLSVHFNISFKETKVDLHNNVHAQTITGITAFIHVIVFTAIIIRKINLRRKTHKKVPYSSNEHIFPINHHIIAIGLNTSSAHHCVITEIRWAYKLIRWKLIVHCTMDGYSRMLTFIWCSNNNRAETVMDLFSTAISDLGRPLHIRTDHGGENVCIWEDMRVQRFCYPVGEDNLIQRLDLKLSSMCRSVFSLAQILFLLGTLNAFKETLFKTMEIGGTDVTDICPNHTTDEILMITCKRSGKTECLVSLKDYYCECAYNGGTDNLSVHFNISFKETKVDLHNNVHAQTITGITAFIAVIVFTAIIIRKINLRRTQKKVLYRSHEEEQPTDIEPYQTFSRRDNIIYSTVQHPDHNF
ncbi:hypothetical protein DPEC_G00153990 [Dallia pectoralis]|uniref:Uncharacterized protein n=1 Tax=Dallia pectoralis TaxID=75939 RepID=A0ACC2GKB6_DALPE|nr:hypothetical protein DPEC_G00153990 [Dallia pectoralis]